MARLLVAVSPKTQARVSEVLAGHDITFVEHADELHRAMQAAAYDMVILGSHFDDSTTLAVLADLIERGTEARIVCVRGVPFRHVGESAMKAFREASLAMGADLVLDLLEFPDDLEGNAAVRQQLQGVLQRGPRPPVSPALRPKP